MMGMGLSLLLFFFSHSFAPFRNGLMGGWTLFSTSQRFRRIKFAGTLVFNDCMEWANVPRWDGNRLGEHGQKISFPLPGSTVPRVAIKRGRLLAEIMRSSKTFRMLHSNYTPLMDFLW